MMNKRRDNAWQGRKLSRGISLVEVLIYMLILSLLALVVVNAILALNSSYRSMRSSAAIEQTAQISLERMVRETRDAASIDLGESALGSSAGKLVLNTYTSNGEAATIGFELSGNRIVLFESGINTGYLSPLEAEVTSLIFRRIISVQSEAVRVEMTAESGTGNNYKSKKFYATAVLRGSYPLE